MTIIGDFLPHWYSKSLYILQEWDLTFTIILLKDTSKSK